MEFKMRAEMLQLMFRELEIEEELNGDQMNLARSRFGLSKKVVELRGLEDDGDSSHNFSAEEESVPEEILLPQNLEVVARDEEPQYKSKHTQESQEMSQPDAGVYQKTEIKKLYEFKCHICGLRFTKMQQLSTHCRHDHQTVPQVLCWCGTILSTWTRLMVTDEKLHER
jgi:hypothetical protein